MIKFGTWVRLFDGHGPPVMVWSLTSPTAATTGFSLLSLVRPQDLVMRLTILQVFVAFMAVSSIKAMAVQPLDPIHSASGDSDDNAEWLKELSNTFEKRGFKASDPRSLFNAVYSNYK